MKIGNLPDNLRFLPQVREKSDSHGGQGSPRDQREKRKDSSEFAEEFDITENTVTQALDGFHADTQAQAAGLHASLEGNGPGLRVVMKDGSGAVIRQFTGEEFLRLREAVAHNPADGRGARGKILDRKF